MSCGKSPLPFISMESCEVGKGISNHAKPTKQFLWPISNVTEITAAGRGGLIWTDTSPYRGLPKAAERCKHSRVCWVCPGASSWEDMAETTQLWSLLMWRSRESNLTPYWMNWTYSVTKGEPRHPLEEANFFYLYPSSYCLVTTQDKWE